MDEHFRQVLARFPAYVPLTVAPDVYEAATTVRPSLKTLRMMGIPRRRVGRNKVLKTSDIVDHAIKALTRPTR